MQPPSLSSEDWLDVALIELQESGFGALKALPLSKKLNVTRGSFYHHFDSLEVFHKAVIAHWSRQSSGEIIRNAIDASDPHAALEELLQRTLRSGERLERAIRSWATVQPNVAREVERVDLGRIEVAEKLLLRSGVAPSNASSRARVLYWAAIGRLMLPFPDKNTLSDHEVSDLAALMLRV